jgi:hypothetical protein
LSKSNPKSPQAFSIKNMNSSLTTTIEKGTTTPDGVALHICTRRPGDMISFGVMRGEFARAWEKLVKLWFTASPKLADIIDGEDSVNGELFGSDAIFTFGVHDWRTAVDAIRQELDALGIAAHCRIAWFDRREGVWRHAWPKTGLPFSPDDLFRQILESIEKRGGSL